MDKKKLKSRILVVSLIVLALALPLIIWNVQAAKEKAEAGSKPREVDAYLDITGYEEDYGKMYLLAGDTKLELTPDIMVDDVMLYAVKNRITNVRFDVLYVKKNATDPGPYRVYTMVSNIRKCPEEWTDLAAFLEYMETEGVDYKEEWRQAIQPRYLGS